MKKIKSIFCLAASIVPLYANGGILMDNICFQNKSTFIRHFIQNWNSQEYVGFSTGTYVYVKKFVDPRSAVTLIDPVQYVVPDPNSIGKQWEVQFTAGFSGIKPDGTGTVLAYVPNQKMRYLECESISPAYPIP
ncbi:MAG: hypothetical protein ACKN9W_15340 [Methylococcus sp.]